MQLMQREDWLLREREERERNLPRVVADKRRLSDVEQRRLYEEEMLGRKPLISNSPHVYSRN